MNRARAHTALLGRIIRTVRIDIPVLVLVAFVAAALGRSGRVKGLLGGGPRVPAQRAADAVEPLRVGAGDGGKRVLRGGDGDVVALAQLDATFAIKGAVRRRARVARHGDAQGHGVGEDHGAERQGVRADGRQEDGGDVWVHEGAAGGEGVGGRAGGRGEDAAVGLDDGEELVVAVELEVGDVGGGPAVDDELVEDLELFPLAVGAV